MLFKNGRIAGQGTMPNTLLAGLPEFGFGVGRHPFVGRKGLVGVVELGWHGVFVLFGCV